MDKDEESETGMYLICRGEVMILNTQQAYKQFLQNETELTEDYKMKSTLTSSNNFSSVSKIGWVITSWILNQDALRAKIHQKLEEIKASELILKIQK